jgi:hypothetical protein
VLVAGQWPEYDSLSQTISELSAIDAPTKTLWALPGALYTILVLLFGWGVVRSAPHNRRLRAVGALIVAYGALGVVWPFAPMHQRDVLAAGGGTLSDTLHLVLASMTVTLMLMAIGIGAAALGPRFRAYSIVSLVVLAVCGALTFRDAPQLAVNGPTPWIGVWERINIGVFLLWIVMLAIATWSAGRDQPGEATRRLNVRNPRKRVKFSTRRSRRLRPPGGRAISHRASEAEPNPVAATRRRAMV